MQFGWTDIEDIVLALDEAHPDVDPSGVRFTALRAMIEALDDFEPEPGQSVNEQILEAVQAGWIEEQADARGGGHGANGPGGNAADTEPSGDDDKPGYQPNNPFR